MLNTTTRRLLPHLGTLVRLVFQRTRAEYSTEVQGILRRSSYTEAGLDHGLDLGLVYSQAAARVASVFKC